MNINLKTNIPFKAHIQFCTKRDFNFRVNNSSNASGSEDFAKGKNVHTHGVYMCNAGGITGSNIGNNKIFHLRDTYFFKHLEKNLKELNENFKNSKYDINKIEKEKAQALIFGADFGFEESRDLAIIIDYLCKKHELDYSCFIGAGDEKALFFDSTKGEKGTWFVNLQRTLYDNKGIPHSRNLFGKNTIMKAFSYIKLSPNDTINFDKEIEKTQNYKNISKGNLNSSKENVVKILEKYKVDPKILDELDFDLNKALNVVG